MKTRSLYAASLAAISLAALAPFTPAPAAEKKAPAYRADLSGIPLADGPFKPDWESLAQYECPSWFQDAKFGIWAHWTAQCVPEQGDWYARNLYLEETTDRKTGKTRPNSQHAYHLAHYGHPSEFGFKDIDNLWHAENWEPEKLIALYQRAGAKYFVALANHHDNFDCFDSQYQPWNSVRLGPKQDIVGGWAKAARAHGLRFGVTVHAARAWNWFEPAQGADKAGPKAGVPYDGKLTKADGMGKWWEGYDPQDLYAQNHLPGEKPDQAYIEKFFRRTKDLIDKYQPDLLYFDDSVMPLNGVSDAGLRLAAHYYNASVKQHGRNEAVMNTKGLNEAQRKCLVWDIERGVANRVEPFVWQTDTCIGSWHYARSLYDRHAYKNAHTVLAMLADIVSKNGNLLLNVPVRGNGTIDDQETAVLEDLAKWMAVNSEAIFGTRPWKVYGEGAVSETGSNFNEGKVQYTAKDVRFTTKGGALYALCLGLPSEPVSIRSLGQTAGLAAKPIAKVEALGVAAPLDWKQTPEALVVQAPAKWATENVAVFKITWAQ